MQWATSQLPGVPGTTRGETATVPATTEPEPRPLAVTLTRAVPFQGYAMPRSSRFTNAKPSSESAYLRPSPRGKQGTHQARKTACCVAGWLAVRPPPTSVASACMTALLPPSVAPSLPPSPPSPPCPRSVVTGLVRRDWRLCAQNCTRVPGSCAGRPVART